MIALVDERRTQVGIGPLCAALGLARATFYRRRGGPPAAPAAARERRPPRQALTLADRAAVLALLHEERFVDLPPAPWRLAKGLPEYVNRAKRWGRKSRSRSAESRFYGPTLVQPPLTRRAALERIAQIRDRIRTLERLCSGSLLRRTKLCGKPGCRCAEDPAARHGPYYEWGRMKGGRLIHRMISPSQAALLREAIVNYRTVRRLLRAWENETVKLMAETADN